MEDKHESKEYIELMRYYFSKVEEYMSVPLAADALGVKIESIEEAVECHRNGLLKETTNEGVENV